jgi:hypothetical protein
LHGHPYLPTVSGRVPETAPGDEEEHRLRVLLVDERGSAVASAKAVASLPLPFDP